MLITEVAKNMKCILCQVKKDKATNKKKVNGLIVEWHKKSIEELNIINENRILDNKYNQIWVYMNRSFMVFDTDYEQPHFKITEFLKNNKLYNEKAISKSFNGLENNFKRHFWFKVDNEKQFKHLPDGQIKFNGGEIFFGKGSIIGEFINTELDEIPTIDINIYNDIYEILQKENKNDKIDISYSDDEDEEKEDKEQNIIMKKNNNIIKGASEKEKEIMQILEGLSTKRYDEYNYWLIVYFVIMNENINIDIFINWSKKSVKYNKENNDNILKNIKPKKGFTISTLYFYLKEDNKILFNELNSNRSDFWNLEINNTSIANFYYQLEPEKYIYTDNGWYEYNDNNILVFCGSVPISLSCGMSRKLQDIAVEIRNSILPSHPKYNEYIKMNKSFYNKVGSDSFIKSTIEQLKLPYEIKNLNEKLHNKNLFSFNNILYDFNKNIYRKINKNDYITTNTGYDLKYKIVNNEIIPEENIQVKQQINDFINSLFENTIMAEYLLDISASSLFGNKEQNFYILTGKGSNGKSLLQNIFNKVLGHYHFVVSNNFLTGSIKKGSADAETAGLEGVRYLNISEPDETDNKKFNVSILKNYSGNDKITCRGLYEKKMISFNPLFTMFILCNDIPELSKIDDGLKRRIKILNFPFQFKKQEQLKESSNYRLINIKLSDILISEEFIQNWATLLLERANKTKNKLLDVPEQVMSNSNNYCNENNILYEWFNASVKITNDKKDKIKATELFNHYNNSEFCFKKIDIKAFYKYMDKLNYNPVVISGYKFYINFIYNEELIE